MNFLLYYIKEKPQFVKRPTQSDPIFLAVGLSLQVCPPNLRSVLNGTDFCGSGLPLRSRFFFTLHPVLSASVPINDRGLPTAVKAGWPVIRQSPPRCGARATPEQICRSGSRSSRAIPIRPAGIHLCHALAGAYAGFAFPWLRTAREFKSGELPPSRLAPHAAPTWTALARGGMVRSRQWEVLRCR
jgi:hypothetical protein